MANRSECDLFIPHKNMRAADLQRLVNDLNQDMRTIERWAQRLLRDCIQPAVNCEAAGSLYGTGQEFLHESGAQLCTFDTEVVECGLTVGLNGFTVVTPGIYHITAHINWRAFAFGTPATAPTSAYISVSPGNDSLLGLNMGWARPSNTNWTDGYIGVSTDQYCAAGSTISLLFSNNAGGTADIDAHFHAHLVHCDCVGIDVGGCL